MPAIAKKSISFDHLQPKFTTFRDDEGNATVRTYQLDTLASKSMGIITFSMSVNIIRI